METRIITIDVPTTVARILPERLPERPPERREFTAKEERQFLRGLRQLLAFQAGAIVALIIVLLVR